jgi:hypothetical protein
MMRKFGFALALGLALLVSGCAELEMKSKCPGVEWEKAHGWTDQKIMQEESLDESDILACGP